MFTPDMGVDVALNQADIMGRLVAEEMSLGDMMTLLKLRKGQFSVVEEKVHPQAAGVRQGHRRLKLPPECVLVAIIRKGELIIPRGDVVLQTGRRDAGRRALVPGGRTGGVAGAEAGLKSAGRNANPTPGPSRFAEEGNSTTDTMRTFQDIILKLHQFWAIKVA